MGELDRRSDGRLENKVASVHRWSPRAEGRLFAAEGATVCLADVLVDEGRAVRGMSRSAARELASHQVRVNSIHPGIIDTPMLRQYDGTGPPEEMTARERSNLS